MTSKQGINVVDAKDNGEVIGRFSCWSRRQKCRVKATERPDTKANDGASSLAVGIANGGLQVGLVQVFDEQELCWQQVATSWPYSVQALVVQH